MKNLDFAIINDFMRVKYLNDCEEMDEKQRDLLDKFTSDSYALVTTEDIKDFESYKDIRNYIKKVLNENNLSFCDNRCYSYLEDGVIEMLSSI